MVECEYCDSSFDDEKSYARHLKSAHEGELSRVDQRRVEDLEPNDDGGIETGVVVIGVVLVAAIGVVGFLVVGMGGIGGAGGEPTNLGSVHEHGTFELVIDGEEVDLNQDQYVENDQAFHFHGDEDSRYGTYVWHTHAQGVTLQYALGTLGFDVSDDGSTITVDGETVDDSNPDESVSIEVDSEAVEPGGYELSGVRSVSAAAEGDGETVVIEIQTGNDSRH